MSVLKFKQFVFQGQYQMTLGVSVESIELALFVKLSLRMVQLFLHRQGFTSIALWAYKHIISYLVIFVHVLDSKFKKPS